MATPAFLVEGYMEQRIIQALCPGQPVRLIGSNGRNVNMTTLAKFIHAHLRRLNNRHYPIVIWLDREQRNDPVEMIITDLEKELHLLGHAPDQFRIAVADRSTENWIVADPEAIVAVFEQETVELVEFAEGCNKAHLEKMLPQGTSYHETTIGYELFLNVRPKVVYAKSVSFRRFVDICDIECDWLKGVRA